LATGVIAMLIDVLAQMIAQIPIVGVVLGIAFFLVGHVLNIMVNVLGSFIHSARLQFLEFFSKFFESGGKKNRPFEFESKYFEIVEQP